MTSEAIFFYDLVKGLSYTIYKIKGMALFFGPGPLRVELWRIVVRSCGEDLWPPALRLFLSVFGIQQNNQLARSALSLLPPPLVSPLTPLLVRIPSLPPLVKTIPGRLLHLSEHHFPHSFKGKVNLICRIITNIK